ncbi:hypothetical protein EDB81DRAFT_907114 [Dactylonectria macrodidyma]|uniref:Rhodopsin domain-containing protein n=1 Tax=Dactylonectria macrodidyma TaxID=307937 RepID=A0A9P9IQV7_9HYPO|nr:hypothetical protein EDB81DRAFT_907114 [Dactylonectria macrodidyma]
MPTTEVKPSFLYEAWALYGIGTIVLLSRFAIRVKTVGWRGFQGDDLFSVFVLIFYAMDAFTVHLIYFLGTNVEASAIQAQGIEISDHDLADFIRGSKLQLAAWYSYTALIWSLKGTMLCFFSRMTIGTWHNMFVKGVSIASGLSYIAVFLTITFGCFPTYKNWQVVPDPGEKCTLKMQNFLVTTVLNVLTDAAILCIPMPLLWKLQVPLKKKLVIGLLLSSGAFVIAAAIIRIVLTLSANPSALTINSWGVRETIVGIITVNIPILRPIFNRSFWTWGRSPISSSMRTNTGNGKTTDISGPYELTPSINDGSNAVLGSKTREHGSQESIIGKSDKIGGVVVRTTYDISHDQYQSGDDWHGGRSGATKASVRAGPHNV